MKYTIYALLSFLTNTAIVAYNDLAVLVACRVLANRGIRVPAPSRQKRGRSSSNGGY
jgi:DNA-binding LacI/PurR family transcriptional regulator